MIEKIENISTFILSKTLLKIIALSLSCFIIFNCIFLSISVNIDSNDLSNFSSIQKDVFSAIFFVSNTIEKINFSLTSKIIATNTEKTDSQKEENKTLPYTNNDIIITVSQIQNETLKLQNNQKDNLVIYNDLLYDFGVTLSSCFYSFYNTIFCFACMIFLFFASIKKLYDIILNSNINRINPAFMHI